ncbi:MAG: cytochrome P450, partial [Actinobacteria bacterium]|nr:cytochrome P450 [Actinomycetota bacterium]
MSAVQRPSPDVDDEGSVAFTACSAESWRNPFPMYAALRDHDPVHHVADRDHWVLSRFDDVWAAARDASTFSSEDGLTTTYGERELIGLDEARPIVMMDPPEHTAFRRLVASRFTPRRVASSEPMVRDWIGLRLDDLRGEEEVDVVDAVFKPLPSMVVAHFLGVPEQDRGRFDGWTEAIVEANAQGSVTSAAEALRDLLGYFAELVERRRVDPGEDVISDLVGSTEVRDAAPLLQILGFAFTMVAGGNDTTTGLLGHAAVELAGAPRQRSELVEDPSLIPGAVEELARLASPVQGLARTTTAEVTLHGRTIPAGRKVLLLYGSANRDP